MANYKRKESEPIEQELQNFYQKIGKKFTEKDDIFEYGQKLGFSIWKLPLDDENLDGIIIVHGRTKKIGLNETLNLQDARFVLAHELGHYIRKDLSNDNNEILIAEKDRIFHGDEKEPRENDMDYMAAAILVPQKAFLKDLEEYDFDYEQFVDKEKAEIKTPLPNDLLEALSKKYCVDQAVISRRVVEVSYYV